jgi:hypothetical protein
MDDACWKDLPRELVGEIFQRLEPPRNVVPGEWRRYVPLATLTAKWLTREGHSQELFACMVRELIRFVARIEDIPLDGMTFKQNGETALLDSWGYDIGYALLRHARRLFPRLVVGTMTDNDLEDNWALLADIDRSRGDAGIILILDDAETAETWVAHFKWRERGFVLFTIILPPWSTELFALPFEMGGPQGLPRRTGARKNQ